MAEPGPLAVEILKALVPYENATRDLTQSLSPAG
jgi:hypothetical protein